MIELISFGYLHGGPPTSATVVTDVRRHFRDPAREPRIRCLTALDTEIRNKVLATRGIPALIDALTAVAATYASTRADEPAVIAVGCAGGRHRSATIVAEIALRLQTRGIPATVTHRDIDKPVTGR